MSRPTRWNTWATGFGLGGNAATDGNAAGLQYSMGGTLAGMEVLDNRHRAGFYGGYLYNYVGTNANESSQVNGGTFGGYYVLRHGNQYVLSLGGFEFDGYESRRRISFAGETAEGDADGWKGYYYTEKGATFGDRRLSLQPFGGLQYIYVRQNGFTETGAAAANLAVPGINTHSLRSVFGSRLFSQQAQRQPFTSRRSFERCGYTSSWKRKPASARSSAKWAVATASPSTASAWAAIGRCSAAALIATSAAAGAPTPTTT